MTESLSERYASSPLFGSNASVVEYYYERFLADPSSVEPHWAQYFRSFLNGGATDTPHGPIRDELIRRARFAAAARQAVSHDGDLEKQASVLRLIGNHRLHGHFLARLDPLGLQEPSVPPDLMPQFHGLTDADLDTEFVTADLPGPDRRPLRDIYTLLGDIYGGSVGAEFAHITNTAERLWLRERFEFGQVSDDFSAEEKLKILRQLTGAEGIERYLHTRYVGQKRFSLEGGESLIPLLDELIQRAGMNGVQECVIGMAHRGRLNVLINVLGKAPASLFSEFEGKHVDAPTRGSGDVKYHMGFSADLRTSGGNVHVALAFNPSHLEIVNPVVEGSVRARQERRNDARRNKVVPILIHGDAAFAGQGVVMETFQLSGARGYSTGGTIHVICNNQIGFTTHHPQDARSTPFCSDVAKMIEAPILHVNADDPEAVIAVTRLALDYRMRFSKDVVIDLVCYRRHGHNEADEPAATQPQMYQAVRSLNTTRQIYAQRLMDEQLVDERGLVEIAEANREQLDKGHPVPEALVGTAGDEHTVDWSIFMEGSIYQNVNTRVSSEDVQRLGEAVLRVPESFSLHARVQRIMDSRRKMLDGEQLMDWGFAETLAYASVLNNGFGVRISGQDSGRGTFFHRHAVLHNQKEPGVHVPLKHVADDQPRFDVIDSLLSEEAVLGFEYGFATTEPRTLVVWEAQFGDFANGAQVVIDQFITSGETKWGRLCGLVLLLPHGYEGQGPEHSSARLERFLQLCAEGNIQVCVPSTPAQMFHLLRRQMVRLVRKPLVVMTPKSLLRHKDAVSPLALLSEGSFRLVVGDKAQQDPERVRRVIFCSGKVFYDLHNARVEHGVDDVAIVRVEQLYPFPAEEYAAEIRGYPNAGEIVWCQEEPQNQGAWYQIRHQLQAGLAHGRELYYAGRQGSAAPAAGNYKMHAVQQQEIVATALGIGKES